MAFAIILWTEDFYSVASASQIHYDGDIFEGLDAMVDWEEGKKGRRAKKLPTQGKLLRLEVGSFSTVLRPLLM